MNLKARRRAGPSALELIETAVHLLRTAPAGVLLAYYAGSVPCALGLLYFWADMSRGAFARDHLIEASLSTALLYVWMKCWQAVFASKLHAHVVHEQDTWTFARVARLVLVQTAIQPSGLFVRLIAANVLFPYVWTYSFYQNVGILGDGRRAGLREVLREAAQQASLWPRQAYAVLFCISGFALFVWFNICIAFRIAPALLSSFFGIETVFSRNWWTMVNTTTLAATLAATYLCVDPLRKAVFMLRCYHGASLKSGEDLRVELKSWNKSWRTVAAALLLGACFLGPLTPARAAEPAPASTESTELNDSVDRVLQRREYAWRLPRTEVIPEDQKGWFETFFDELLDRLERTTKEVFRWIGKVWRWISKILNRAHKVDTSSSSMDINWSATARWTLYALVALLIVVVGVLLWRWRQGRKARVDIAEPLAVVPDLNEENVTADQLPEDGWLGLARELMAKGELRLALRAFYLATLAHLGHRELIRLARHKSNHDYDRELQRRARGNAGLIDAFDENLLTFERAWYGEHDVTSATLHGFSQNIERIRTC